MSIVKQYHPASKTTYVYESTSRWVPELKQSRCTRRLIGKLGPNGEILPTGKPGRPKKIPDSVQEQNSTGVADGIEAELVQQKTENLKLQSRIMELETENRKLQRSLEKARLLAANIQNL